MKYRILEMADGTFKIQSKNLLLWVEASSLNFDTYDEAYNKIEQLKERQKEIYLSKTIKKIWNLK